MKQGRKQHSDHHNNNSGCDNYNTIAVNTKTKNSSAGSSASSSSSQNNSQKPSSNISFDNVIKGPLKLKGRASGITKQHKTTSNNNTNNKYRDSRSVIIEEKTEAEEKYETRSMERKKNLIKEKAQKSYREKINEFNERISKLSEYHDLPKV